MTTHARPDFHRIVARLAITNVPRSVQDAAFIRETVDDIERQAAEVRAQMLMLTQSLNDHEQTLQDLENERQFFKSLLSPIRRMPLEVLGEIFICATDDYRRQSVLARICRVSKNWREAAYLIPSLWKTITIDPSKRKLTYGAVNSWIGRARGLPRTVIIALRQCGQGEDDAGSPVDCCAGEAKCPLSKKFLVKILTKTRSLERVDISCPSPQCFENLSTLIAKAPPSASWNSVSSITLMWDDWEDDWEYVDSDMLNRFLPRSTRSLQLCLPREGYTGIIIDELQDNIPLNVLNRLTTFHLTCDWGARHIFEILYHCSNLETLNLGLRGSELDVDIELEDAFMLKIKENGLPMPKLNTCRLEDVYPSSSESLRLIKMPNVLHVDVQFGDEDWTPKETDGNVMTVDDGLAFSTFLRGSNDNPSSVRTLRIANGTFAADTMLNAVKDLPSLECLTVDNALFRDDLFSKLSAMDALPSLKVLQLLHLHCDSEKFLELQAFVDKRGIKLATSRCKCVDCIHID